MKKYNLEDIKRSNFSQKCLECENGKLLPNTGQRDGAWTYITTCDVCGTEYKFQESDMGQTTPSLVSDANTNPKLKTLIMETTKYYTPEKSEFHIGLEYEFQSADDLESDWQTAIIKNGTQIDDITREYKGSPVYNLRVRRLDREDIESLGWIPSTSYKEYFTFGDYGIKTLYDNKIEIYVDDAGSEYGYVNIFVGSVKNKSELSKLMSMLNIK